jgi:hypothetical protein
VNADQSLTCIYDLFQILLSCVTHLRMHGMCVQMYECVFTYMYVGRKQIHTHGHTEKISFLIDYRKSDQTKIVFYNKYN